MRTLSRDARTMPRMPKPDPVVLRRVWRGLIDDARRAATRVEETDGEQIIDSVDFAHALSTAVACSFPVEGFSAETAAGAFLENVRAMREATLPARRACLTHAVLGGCRTLEGLLDEEGMRAAAIHSKRIGESEQ